jgi:hypothetical protein
MKLPALSVDAARSLRARRKYSEAPQPIALSLGSPDITAIEPTIHAADGPIELRLARRL